MLGLIVGLGIAAFILAYFSSIVDKDHFLLKLLISFFVFYLLILIPKTIVDNNDFCEIVVDSINKTYIYGNNFTGYHWEYVDESVPPKITDNAFVFHIDEKYNYERVCFENSKNTDTTFYKILVWFLRLYFTYILIYFIYSVWLVHILKKWKIIPSEKGGKNR